MHEFFLLYSYYIICLWLLLIVPVIINTKHIWTNIMFLQVPTHHLLFGGHGLFGAAT